MRLLVVEDNEMVANFVVKGLREEGYAVDLASRGDEVAQLVAVAEYDLLVLDVMLPGLSGFDLLARLRGEAQTMPIIMLTAKAEVEDRVKGLNMGADDYLTKPFAFAELLARVRALLRRGGQTPGGDAETLRLDDLAVDPISRKVTRGQRELELTAKEFSLLDFLLRNQGRVLSRTTIIEHVWDRHFDSDTNLIDVYVQRLRKKLEEEGGERLIFTRRGMGYVMKAPE
ncbi:MAG: response regulator transcription factor [Lentisphaeria bacterium]|nr:response regulator transcription factor [Lentisphaeria bacterium]